MKYLKAFAVIVTLPFLFLFSCAFAVLPYVIGVIVLGFLWRLI